MSLQTRHEWTLAPFKMTGDFLPDEIRAELDRNIDPKLAERIACASLGKFSMGTAARNEGSLTRAAGKAISFGSLYGTPGGTAPLGKRWRCTRCRRIHYSEKVPPSTPMKAVRVKRERGGRWWAEMPLVPCRYSHMPTYEVQPFGTCDEEMVRWVMES